MINPGQQTLHVNVMSISKALVMLRRDSLAEWSKALAQGTSPQGRGFEPHSRHLDNGNLGGDGSFGHLRSDVMPKRT